MESFQYGKQDIAEIAKLQRLLCWVFLLTMACSFFSRIVAFGITVFMSYYMYRLAKALKVKYPWLYVLGFIPLVSIVVLVRAIRHATKVLHAHNIHVGLMGANKANLNTFLSSTV